MRPRTYAFEDEHGLPVCPECGTDRLFGTKMVPFVAGTFTRNGTTLTCACGTEVREPIRITLDRHERMLSKRGVALYPRRRGRHRSVRSETYADVVRRIAGQYTLVDL